MQLTETKAKSILRGLKRVEASARKDKRASEHYWNGDTWGSISGVRDAEEWVENQLVGYLIARLDNV